MRYFRTLMLCVSVSLGVLVLGPLVPALPEWVIVLAAVSPLAYYHLGYLQVQLRKEPSAAAIDSVYYYGFLITVAALAISAIEIAAHPAAPSTLGLVLNRFGLGLLATGYAVFARLHLQSRVIANDEVAAEAKMDSYVQRSGELVDNVEAAIVRVSGFSEQVTREAAELQSSARSLVEHAMVDAARAFESEMRLSLASARDSIAEIRGLLSDSGFVAERSELRKLVSATIDTSRELNRELGEFAARSRASAEATAASAAALTTLDVAVSGLGRGLEELTQAGGPLQRTVANADALTVSLSTAAESAQQSAGAIGGAAREATTMSKSFESMRAYAETAADQLASMTRVSERLDQALAGMTAATEATSSFSREIGKLGETLPTLAHETANATDQMRAIKAAVAGSAKELEADVARSAKAATLLTASLVDVADLIIDKTRQRQGRQ